MNIKTPLILCLLSILLMISVSCTSSTVNDSASTNKETDTLEKISPSLSQNSNILLLKEKGYLDEFIILLENEHSEATSAHLSSIKPQLDFWGLSFEDTVVDVERKTQEYLDKHYPGTKIGDEEFNKLVNYYINNTDTPTAKKAREEADFGAIYCYMSLYNQYPRDTTGKRVFYDDTYNLTLRHILNGTLSFDANKVLTQFLYDKGLSETLPKTPTTKNITE